MDRSTLSELEGLEFPIEILQLLLQAGQFGQQGIQPNVCRIIHIQKSILVLLDLFLSISELSSLCVDVFHNILAVVVTFAEDQATSTSNDEEDSDACSSWIEEEVASNLPKYFESELCVFHYRDQYRDSGWTAQSFFWKGSLNLNVVLYPP
jgi:hypothetical protein